jgi:uncharacterized protein YuzE
MKLHVDEMGDALYFKLTESKIVESEEVHPHIVLDFDERGEIVGIEFLGLKTWIPRSELRSIEFKLS